MSIGYLRPEHALGASSRTTMMSHSARAARGCVQQAAECVPIATPHVRHTIRVDRVCRRTIWHVAWPWEVGIGPRQASRTTLR